MYKIGLLTYQQHPQKQFPPLRLRALLAESALQQTELVLLDVEHCNIEQNRIRTSIWRENYWQQKQCILPDLVIIIGSPDTPEKEQVHNWVLSQRPVICDRSLGKLQTSSLLEATEAQVFLIPWDRIPNSDTRQFLHNFIALHGGIVVKLDDANQGIGLSFLYPSENKQEWVLKNDRSHFRGSLEESISRLLKRIEGRIHYRDYIVQQYIHSSTSDGRAFDVRVHVQRQSAGQWGITRGYIRLAEENSPLPNTSKGGYQGDLQSFLLRRDKFNARAIEQELYDAAIKITDIFDKSRELPLSEAGVDFVLDKENKIYLVEINAFPQSTKHELERAVHTIAYAKYLCEKESKMTN